VGTESTLSSSRFETSTLVGTRVGFEVEGVIDRLDFDLKWNRTLPNGNLLVSDHLRKSLDLAGARVPEAERPSARRPSGLTRIWC
jgi:hypothetical protein